MITKICAVVIILTTAIRDVNCVGCCTQNFATCVTYCGTTEQACTTCPDTTVVWIPNGVPLPPVTCISRWSACTSNVNGCCPGLTCQGDKNWAGCQYNATVTTQTKSTVKPASSPGLPTAAPIKRSRSPAKRTTVHARRTVSPARRTTTPIQHIAPVTITTTAPNTAPSSPIQPTLTPVASSSGCCTQTFATCVTYCGTTKLQCQTCASTDVAWLSQGAPPPNSCLARWTDCTNNPNNCCQGLTCIFQSQGYAGCQYLNGPTPPPIPTSPVPPTAAPVQPIPAPQQPTVAPLQPIPTAPIVVPMAPTLAPAPTLRAALFSTSKAATTWSIFQSLSTLTAINSVNPPVYAYLSSGGAAGNGNVVSEGQGYALFITGTILASWSTHAQSQPAGNRDQVLTAFWGYFNGWKTMCQKSSAPCQPSKLCQDSSGTLSVCLPDWIFGSSLSSPQGNGSAPDGDEDAIVGMILAVKAVANDSPRPSWYDEVRKWADASATAFMTYETLANDPSAPNQRLVKLGSCWGGWGSNGQNPSYHSPGSYKLMRDYQATFPNSDRYTPATFTSNDWNMLIQTSYALLFGVQCPAQGMVPNWAAVSYVSSTGTITSTGAGFSGSGTPQYEFGSEAARTIWRVAMDAAFFPTQGSSQTSTFLAPLLKQLKSGYAPTSPPFDFQASTFTSCSAPNMSNSITVFSGGWLDNPFIYAPVVSALIVPLSTLSASQQQAMIDAAGTALQSNLPTSYYPLSWTMLGSLMVNGAIASAGATASCTGCGQDFKISL